MMLVCYLRVLRPAQWLKNLMLLFPPFLGGSLLSSGTLGQMLLPLAAFCLASSSTYVFNDIRDAANDAHHPRKKNRPIAAGEIPRLNAALLSALLLVVSVWLGLLVSLKFAFFLLAYLAVSVSYSLKLKEVPTIDVFCITGGFVLRLHAGGEAFSVVISDWLFLSVFLLALFLSTGKRLCEKMRLGGAAASHRKALGLYPDGFLEGTLYMTGAVTLVTYTMYVITRPALVYTVPLCTYGLLRYLYRLKQGLDGDPTDVILKDPHVLVVSVAWVLMVGFSLYSPIGATH